LGVICRQGLGRGMQWITATRVYIHIYIHTNIHTSRCNLRSMNSAVKNLRGLFEFYSGEC